MSNSTMSEEQLISELLNLDLSDGKIGFTHLDRRDVYLLLPIIKKYTLSKQIEAQAEYEDELLSTLDDISNKPWRAARHIRELYENTDSGITDWYKEVANDWGLLEEFFSNGGMNKIRNLMADPEFNVNHSGRIAELRKQQEGLK